jgi:hypothetical protein
MNDWIRLAPNPFYLRRVDNNIAELRVISDDELAGLLPCDTYDDLSNEGYLAKAMEQPNDFPCIFQSQWHKEDRKYLGHVLRVTGTTGHCDCFCDSIKELMVTQSLSSQLADEAICFCEAVFNSEYSDAYYFHSSSLENEFNDLIEEVSAIAERYSFSSMACWFTDKDYSKISLEKVNNYISSVYKLTHTEARFVALTNSDSDKSTMHVLLV